MLVNKTKKHLLSLNHQAGLSLIELILSITVLSLVMSFMTATFSPMMIRSADPFVSIRAAELGESYLEEILSKAFDETMVVGTAIRCDSPGEIACSATLGPDGNESREVFDDVDDYHGLTDSPPIDLLGNQKPLYQNYQAAVSVVYAGQDLGLNNRMAKKITVTIRLPNEETMLFSVYRANL